MMWYAAIQSQFGTVRNNVNVNQLFPQFLFQIWSHQRIMYSATLPTVNAGSDKLNLLATT